MSIQAEKITVGQLETNCYIVYDKEMCTVIDPGDEPEKILEKIAKIGRRTAAILLTHGHFDHIGAAARLRRETGAPIYIHAGDAEMTADPIKNLSFMTGVAPEPFSADAFVNDGDTLAFGEMKFDVMHTPGHSAGGVCYCAGAVIFGGDLIFRGSVGRFDYGSFDDEMKSIGRVLSSFPDETLILPGHGERTTVGYEKKHNPYVKNGVGL